jgi:hypothetical protein
LYDEGGELAPRTGQIAAATARPTMPLTIVRLLPEETSIARLI